MPVGSAFFLVGPTAVGKSEVAQWIAEKHDFAILSADAMLVYKGMDIGTAKPEASQRSRVRYDGIDLVTPDQPFSVWEFHQQACRSLTENVRRGIKTIVVGGTGLYIKSLTDGLSPQPVPDPVSRARWEKIAEEQGVEALQQALRSRNPEFYDSLQDPQNPRRLIRALELAESGMALASRSWARREDRPALAGLFMEAPRLGARIEQRVRRMFADGFTEEVRRLRQEYAHFSRSAAHAIGYAECLDLLEGRCSKEEAILSITGRTLKLAKKQRTWFRHQANVQWLEVKDGMDAGTLAQQVLAIWKQCGPTEVFDVG